MFTIFAPDMIKKLYIITIIPYTVLLLYFMFLGFGRTPFSYNIVRLTPIVSTYYFVKETSHWYNIFINIVGNVVMFAPFGFLGWIFPKFNEFKSLIITFLTVLIIVEALQYFTRLGVFDVDDILLNSMGVWLGFRLWKRYGNVIW